MSFHDEKRFNTLLLTPLRAVLSSSQKTYNAGSAARQHDIFGIETVPNSLSIRSMMLCPAPTSTPTLARLQTKPCLQSSKASPPSSNPSPMSAETLSPIPCLPTVDVVAEHARWLERLDLLSTERKVELAVQHDDFNYGGAAGLKDLSDLEAKIMQATQMVSMLAATIGKDRFGPGPREGMRVSYHN